MAVSWFAMWFVWHYFTVTCETASLTEYSVERTDKVACVGNRSQKVEKHSACSILCNLNDKCIAFLYISASKDCQQCNTYSEELSGNTGDNIFGRKVFQDCEDLGHQFTGLLLIRPKRSPKKFFVSCESGWTIIQRRINGSLNFTRTWEDYKHGFGNLDSEMWLGNEKLHYITAHASYKLQYEMTEWNATVPMVIREHDSFVIHDESQLYKIAISPALAGDLGSSMEEINGMLFSTYDNDNDNKPVDHCAVPRGGGWWYDACSHVNLNAHYPQGGQCSKREDRNCMKYGGVTSTDHKHLKHTVMKIRKCADHCN